jgi:hypothetical protein
MAVYLHGEVVSSHYVIAKGKRSFYFLAEVKGLYENYVWKHANQIFSKENGQLCTFKSEADAKAVLSQLPDKKMYEGAYIKTLELKLV